MKKIALAVMIVGLLAAHSAAQSPRIELIVKGRVLDYEGKAVARAEVTAGPIGPLKGVVPNASSDAQGEFSIVVHQTGEFLVSAQKTVDGYPSTSNAFYYPHTATATRVTVLEGQPAPYATVQFGPKAGKILLRVSDAETGQPIRTVALSLCRVEAPKYCHRVKNNTRVTTFPVQYNAPIYGAPVLVPSEPFTLEVSAEGYESFFYGEMDRDLVLQSLQVPSDTVKELTIELRKGSDNRTGRLPAPKIVSPADRAVLINVPHPRMLTVEWAAVPGAATYTVEVEGCERGAPEGDECGKGTFPLLGSRWPPPSGIEGTKYQFVFVGAQPGRWRVWAVDEQGRLGAKSPWTLFIYVWKQ
jgi:hypothetical protein